MRMNFNIDDKSEALNLIGNQGESLSIVSRRLQDDKM